EKRLTTGGCRSPGCEVGLERSAVPVFVCVFELVERAILGIEKRAVTPKEVVVDRITVRQNVCLGHGTPSLCARRRARHSVRPRYLSPGPRGTTSGLRPCYFPSTWGWGPSGPNGHPVGGQQGLRFPHGVLAEMEDR